jgi:hypothetical protein
MERRLTEARTGILGLEVVIKKLLIQAQVTDVKGDKQRYLSHLFYYKCSLSLKSVCPPV